MTTGETEAFATRLTAEEAAQIQEVLDNTDLNKAHLIARGFRFYLKENPDNLPAFRSDNYENDPLAEAGVLPPETDWTLEQIL
jgi:hypothetical protein